jgi:hypothetical protein
MQNFEPTTWQRVEGRTCLLVFDRHESHTTPNVIRHYILNRIPMALLLPHSPHLT